MSVAELGAAALRKGTGRMSLDRKNSDDAGPSNARSAAGPSRHSARGTSVGQASGAVGNQAKKQEELTRQGTQKMRFIPTLPLRRKKTEADLEVKQEEASLPKTADSGRGRGRGGRGRGVPPPPRPEMQMTASGPFAMGPALAGSSNRRAPRSNFTPVMPMGGSAVPGLSGSGPPVLERARTGNGKKEDEDIEVYSDPDEGVQIVDMDAIKTMDWMAPESLRRELNDGRRSSKKITMSDVAKKDTKGKKKASRDDVSAIPVEGDLEKDAANALDLSESEKEEEMEDLLDDFAVEDENMDEDTLTRQEKLYFFQFPRPFPTFTLADENESHSKHITSVDSPKPGVDDQQTKASDTGKKVSFAADVKPPAANGSQGDQAKNEPESVPKDGVLAAHTAEEVKLDGIIGQLEVHRSGVIKMRLNNGMLMDVTAATQPSFLQHAVYLDPVLKKMLVLGEVNRRFVVSPDVDRLLQEMEEQAIENIENNAQDEAMDTK